jgi:2-methylisocitrate lyase-like PEP mutase family enzyme
MQDLDTAATFAALHEAPRGFIMPNAWDVGSALTLADAGFPAIGTTSAGIAFSLGKQDYGVTTRSLAMSRREMLQRASEIAAAVRIPVNVDLEAGYGDSPEAVAETVQAAMDAGLAGGNIEDKVPFEPRLYGETLAAERIAAARAVIDASGARFVLTARCDAAIWCENGLAEAIRRSHRYRAAGADCLFTPGISDLASIKSLVEEVRAPINLVMGLGTAEGNAYQWIEAGVQRISLGGSMARAAYYLLQQWAAELRGSGSVSFAENQMTQSALNDLFNRLHHIRE